MKILETILKTIIVYRRRMIYLALGKLDQTLHLKPELIILCYHSFDSDNWFYGVDQESLEEQISLLLKNYTPITLGEVQKIIEGVRIIDKPSFVVTIDDGYADVYKTKDFFKKVGIKPTLFMLADTDHANRKELENNKKFLTKEQVQELIKEGWRIGSHSLTHSDFYKLSQRQIYNEVIQSKKILEKKFGLKIDFFAYPKGRYTTQILAALMRAGYTLGLSMDDGFITENTHPLKVPRIGINRTHSLAEFASLYSPSNIRLRNLIKQSGLAKYFYANN